LRIRFKSGFQFAPVAGASEQFELGTRVVVADSDNHRLQVLNRASRRVDTVKTSHDLCQPTALVWDPDTAELESAIYLLSDGKITRVNLLTGEVSAIVSRCPAAHFWPALRTPCMQ
jgi:hypothetical protein